MTELAISTKNCIIEQKGQVLVVTLNRPEKKNAFNSPMVVGLYRAWRRLEEDDSLLCAVLTANGDTFCAGMDLSTGPEGGSEGHEEIQTLMQDVPNLPWQSLLRENIPNKPIILAVEGYALAGGTEILQGTDIRVAAEDAIFGVTEVARGLYPMSGSTVKLRRQIPYALAAEMLLLGEHISAHKCHEWGLINHVVGKGEALYKAMELAEKICRNGSLAVKAVMKSLRQHDESMPLVQALKESDELAMPVLSSKDAREGMRAFMEKRPAVFQGK